MQPQESPAPHPAPADRPPFRPKRPPQERPQQSSAWERELNKCIGREVKVRAMDGPVFEGVLVAIQFNHLSVIVMTPTHKVVVKQVVWFERKRNFNEPPRVAAPAPPAEL